MVFLQGADGELVFYQGFNAVDCCLCTGDGGYDWNVIHNCKCADGHLVGFGFFP